MPIENIFSAMQSATEKNNLPKIFKDDLQQDYRLLQLYDTDFIWLMRTCGTTLVPIGVGVDPLYITYWKYEKHGQTIIPYLIKKKEGHIEKISFEHAESLILKLPNQLNTFHTTEEIVQNVQKVLENGKNKRIWGTFVSPELDIHDWSGWLDYFTASKNELMKVYLKRAMYLLENSKARPQPQSNAA